MALETQNDHYNIFQLSGENTWVTHPNNNNSYFSEPAWQGCVWVLVPQMSQVSSVSLLSFGHQTPKHLQFPAFTLTAFFLFLILVEWERRLRTTAESKGSSPAHPAASARAVPQNLYCVHRAAKRDSDLENVLSLLKSSAIGPRQRVSLMPSPSTVVLGVKTCSSPETHSPFVCVCLKVCKPPAVARVKIWVVNIWIQIPWYSVIISQWMANQNDMRTP